MHIHIIKQCLRVLNDGGYCIMLHPASPFIKQGKGQKNFDEEDLQYLRSLDFLNPAYTFGGAAELAAALSISKFCKKPESQIVVTIDGKTTVHDNINTVSIHSGKTGYSSFKEKMLSHSAVLCDFALDPKDGKYNTTKTWFVELSRIVGDFPRKNAGNQRTVEDFYKICFFYAGKTMEVLHAKDVKAKGAKYAFAFDTKQEAINCLRFLKTKFARACLSIFKYNLHADNVHLSTTPWLDFSKTWTDADLFEYFNLSEDEKSFVRSMSDIYPDYSES